MGFKEQVKEAARQGRDRSASRVDAREGETWTLVTGDAVTIRKTDHWFPSSADRHKVKVRVVASGKRLEVLASSLVPPT